MPDDKNKAKYPGNPEKPSEVKPEKPEEAKKPEAPAKPAEGKPEKPEEAKKPEASAKPAEVKPEKPEGAKRPEAPAKPTEVKPEKPEGAKKPEAPAKPAEGKPEKPEEAKKPEAPAKPAEVKPEKPEGAKKPEAPAKPVEAKSGKPEEAKKPEAPAKPTELKPEKPEAAKKPEAPAKPQDNKAARTEAEKKADEPKKPAEQQKKAEGPATKATAADPQKKQADNEKAGAVGLGLAITQIFADRLDYPDEKAMKALPVPKENEGFSMRLHPAYFREFLDHPFSINRNVKDYKDLYESIRDNGISEPVLARPGKNGGLELISGHRRHDIAKQLNYPIPVVIRQIDDDSAQIAVVDGNLHRQDIPTSELARAAKMKMDALARKAGRRSKMEQLTAPEKQKRTDQIVAEDMGMSRNQVQRLVRIDALVPELKQQVDDKKLPFNTAVELSYLKPEEQKQVVDVMQKEQVTPSMAQATQLKEASRQAASLEKTAPSAAATHKVDEKKVAQIIKPKADPPLKVTLTELELKAYFPSPLPSPFVIKQTIYEALSMRKKALEKQAKKDAAKDTVKGAVKPAR